MHSSWRWSGQLPNRRTRPNCSTMPPCMTGDGEWTPSALLWNYDQWRPWKASDGARVNIIVVSDFAHVTGGNAAVALASADGLARQGHAVTVFAGVGPVSPEIAAGPVQVVCTGQQAIA